MYRGCLCVEAYYIYGRDSVTRVHHLCCHPCTSLVYALCCCMYPLVHTDATPTSKPFSARTLCASIERFMLEPHTMACRSFPIV